MTAELEVESYLVRLDVTVDRDEWQDRAVCAQTDPEAFFPEKGGSTQPAKKICARCDVRAECLNFALTTDQRFGVYGGYSERERRRMKPAGPVVSVLPDLNGAA